MRISRSLCVRGNVIIYPEPGEVGQHFHKQISASFVSILNTGWLKNIIQAEAGGEGHL